MMNDYLNREEFNQGSNKKEFDAINFDELFSESGKLKHLNKQRAERKRNKKPTHKLLESNPIIQLIELNEKLGIKGTDKDEIGELSTNEDFKIHKTLPFATHAKISLCDLKKVKLRKTGNVYESNSIKDNSSISFFKISNSILVQEKNSSS